MNRRMQDFLYRVERSAERLPGKNKKRSLILAALLGALLLIVPMFYAISWLRSGGDEVGLEIPEGPSPQVHARDAWNAVFAALVGEEPAASVSAAVQRVANEKSPAFLTCPATGRPYLFNPAIDDWTRTEKPPKSGVLLYRAASDDGKTPALLLGRGALPRPADEPLPAWLDKAVTAPPPA